MSKATHTYTQNSTAYCSSTATKTTRTNLTVTFRRALPVLLNTELARVEIWD